MKKKWSCNWSLSLKGNLIPVEDLPAAIEASTKYLNDPPTTKVSWQWHPAVEIEPTAPLCFGHQDLRWRHTLDPPDFIPPTPGTPCSANPTIANIGPWLPGRGLTPWAAAADLLASCIEYRRKAIIWKHKRITELHTTEWYQQSANKEADE